LQSCYSDTVNVNVSTGRVDVVLHDGGRKAPLLLTELVVAPDNSNFCFSTPIDGIASRIIAIFDRAITKSQASSTTCCRVVLQADAAATVRVSVHGHVLIMVMCA
jgi:hypothetical protein